MGSHEEVYQDRKAKTIGYMRSIGEVIEFDALGADKAHRWEENLKKEISRLSTSVFRGNGRGLSDM